MLQQTQVATVIPYFLRFVEAMPELRTLANADHDAVMALWSGLGYYSRARNLHRAAQLCVERHDGELPGDPDALLALPGIGRSTAGAILALAFDQRAAILDGNVKRVLCRSHGIEGFPGAPAVEKKLWQLADDLLPAGDLANYTQALMDLGATVCTRGRPRCGQCPLKVDCIALATDRVAALPTARPARKSPERTCHWLLLVDTDDRILLERRPTRGVWGGLWSLPEFPDADALRTHLALRLGRLPDHLETLSPVRHIFTHFTLTASPMLCRLQAWDPAIADGDSERWLRASELGFLGLPQPVRTLLAASMRDDATRTTR